MGRLHPELGFGSCGSLGKLRSWFGYILVKFFLDKLGHWILRAKVLCKLLVDAGMLLQIMLPESWKVVFAAGATPVKACFMVKLLHLLKRCKLDNDIAKLDVQAAEGRLMLRSLLLSTKAKLTIRATEVQADGVAKLQSFVLRLRRKAWHLELKADDISCLCSNSGARQAVQAQKLTAFAKLLEACQFPRLAFEDPLTFC